MSIRRNSIGKKFQPGDRVKHSELGAQMLLSNRSRKKISDLATVQGYANAGGVHVVWDGFKTHSIYAEVYLEKVRS